MGSAQLLYHAGKQFRRVLNVFQLQESIHLKRQNRRFQSFGMDLQGNPTTSNIVCLPFETPGLRSALCDEERR